jgi:glycosyltransferase involved in cell wall biosynthesis
MPTYNSNLNFLSAAISSVINQIYPNWELCIADDASTDMQVFGLLENYQKQDSRIKIVRREINGHISAASNTALEMAQGEWIAFLDHDDLLPPGALFWVADATNKKPNIQIIYSDEDKVDSVGRRFDPYFKPDWNRDLFYSQNYFCHLGVYRKQLIDLIDGLT